MKPFIFLISPPPPLLQGDRMDREAMKCQVLTVSNHSCESLTLVGNTLECTVPTELQTTASKELQVEVRPSGSVHVLGFHFQLHLTLQVHWSLSVNSNRRIH